MKYVLCLGRCCAGTAESGVWPPGSFGGGASVLLRKPRTYAEVYNDMDGELVNLFRVARDQGEELIRVLTLTPFASDEFFAAYDKTEDPLERARRTVILAYMGFGSNSVVKVSGFRSNTNRSGTTAAHAWAHYPDCLSATIKRLRGVIIENRDAKDIMLKNDGPDTLHYVDPPYVHSTRSYGKGGYRFEMTDDQHRELALFLVDLKGAVTVSGYPSELYDKIYSSWDRIERKTMADGAKPRVEVLWLRNCDHGLFSQRPVSQSVPPLT
jgi:DNA adenine methylase